MRASDCKKILNIIFQAQQGCYITHRPLTQYKFRDCEATGYVKRFYLYDRIKQKFQKFLYVAPYKIQWFSEPNTTKLDQTQPNEKISENFMYQKTKNSLYVPSAFQKLLFGIYLYYNPYYHLLYARDIRFCIFSSGAAQMH